MTLRGILLPLLLLAGAAHAEDFVRSKGPLGDADFYRLVTCGRPPGGQCRMPPKRWPDDLARDLTVSLLPAIEPVRPARAAQVDAALDAAIAQINAVGAAVTLRRVADNSPARIRLSIRSPATMALIANGRGAQNIPAGMVLLLPPSADRITGATILIASDIALREANSVVLEELTQSLGLVYDIDDPNYDRRSIFSQRRNSVTVLTGQDATALRLHYPPKL
jgi:hypothetical protein